MFSLEALFGHVDDFCHWFEPRWQRQLLRWLTTTTTFSQAVLERGHDDCDCIPSVGLPQFQGFYTQFVCQHWRRAFPGVGREGEEVGELSTFFLYFPCTATSLPSSLILALVRFYPKGSQC